MVRRRPPDHSGPEPELPADVLALTTTTGTFAGGILDDPDGPAMTDQTRDDWEYWKAAKHDYYQECLRRGLPARDTWLDAVRRGLGRI